MCRLSWKVARPGLWLFSSDTLIGMFVSTVRTVSVLQVPALSPAELVARVREDLAGRARETAAGDDAASASVGAHFELAPSWVSRPIVTVRPRSSGRPGSELLFRSRLRPLALVCLCASLLACGVLVAGAALPSDGGGWSAALRTLIWPLPLALVVLSVQEADRRNARALAAHLARP